jgi:hypothetical protein
VPLADSDVSVEARYRLIWVNSATRRTGSDCLPTRLFDLVRIRCPQCAHGLLRSGPEGTVSLNRLIRVLGSFRRELVQGAHGILYMLIAVSVARAPGCRVLSAGAVCSAV